jgi:hypothetical protein
MRQCAFAGGVIAHPDFKCPDCVGPPTHQVKDYYRGRVRTTLGPHLLLCQAHAAWHDQVHPFGPRATRMRKRKTSHANRRRTRKRQQLQGK